MKRLFGTALLLALVSATGCAARQTTTPGSSRGPVIQRTADPVEVDHGDLTRPVFGQGN